MVKKKFIVEIQASDNAKQIITAGQILHAIIPVAERISFGELEAIKCNDYEDENGSED